MTETPDGKNGKTLPPGFGKIIDGTPAGGGEIHFDVLKRQVEKDFDSKMVDKNALGRLVSENGDHKEEMEGEKFSLGISSIASEKHPDRNEDSFLSMLKEGVFGVFDGMQGYKGGEIASSTARDAIRDFFSKLSNTDVSLEDVQEDIRDALKHANEKILEKIKTDEELNQMGTTASLVKFWEGPNGERKIVIGNVGDSRVYIFRENGTLEQATIDQSYTNYLLEIRYKDYNEETRRKKIKEDQQRLSNVTNLNELNEDDQGLLAPEIRSRVSGALGREDYAGADIFVENVYPGDKVVILSDGPIDNSPDARIEQILREEPDCEKASNSIVEESLGISRLSRVENFRAKKDDMTAMVIKVPEAKNLNVAAPASDIHYDEQLPVWDGIGPLENMLDEKDKHPDDVVGPLIRDEKIEENPDLVLKPTVEQFIVPESGPSKPYVIPPPIIRGVEPVPEAVPEAPLTPEEIELAAARTEYAKELIAYKNETRKKRNVIGKIFAGLGAGDKEVEGVNRDKLDVAEKAYLEAKKKKSTDLLKTKGELEKSGDDAEKKIAELFMGELIVQAEKEDGALQKSVMEGIPPLQRTRLIKALDWWGKQNRYARIVMSTALMTGVVTGVNYMSGGDSTAGTAAYTAAARLARAAGGVFASQVAGKAVDMIVKKIDKTKEKALTQYETDLNLENFEQKEKERMSSVDKIKNLERKTRLIKAGVMAGVGGLASAGIGSAEHAFFSPADVPVAGGGASEALKPSAVLETPTPTPRASIPVPEAPPVQAPNVAEVPEIKVSLSSKGFIQDIHNLKAEIVAKYQGKVIPDSIQKNFLGKPSMQLAKDLHFYDPEHHQSAMGFKGESLSIDKDGNLIYEHLKGGKEVMLDTKTGEIHHFVGKMIDSKDVPEVDSPSMGVSEVSGDTGPMIPSEDALAVDQSDYATLSDTSESPEVIPEVSNNVLYQNSFVEVVNKSGGKVFVFNGAEIAHEKGGMLILDEKFQNGVQNQNIRGAFVTAFEKNVGVEQIGENPIAVPFEGGKIYIAQGVGGNPNSVKIFLNGREMAGGMVGSSGASVKLLDVAGIKGGIFFADTPYERAFKQVKGVLKNLKPVAVETLKKAA